MKKEEKLLCGERLRGLRARCGLTQEEAADKLNISLRYYQMLERGEKLGSVDILLAVSEMMNCSLDYLLKGAITGNSPLTARLNRLSARQRGYAERLLELWLESQEQTESC